jgi:predicted amidophosphoribosyltransferase
MQSLSGDRMGDTVIQGGYMVCSSCGVDLPNNRRFCPYCGRAQSVASPSVGAAAAQPRRGAAGWILGALFLLLSCPQASGSAVQTPGAFITLPTFVA